MVFLLKINVFPTHVGVFLKTCDDSGCHKCLPHARGGVSQAIHELIGYGLSSPRTWGCFCRQKTFSYDSSVFPTHVGVFPPISAFCDRRTRLPHARGGVSMPGHGYQRSPASSPRTWGCFWIKSVPCTSKNVFPTHVGVFPHLRFQRGEKSCLPHARGGVS